MSRGNSFNDTEDAILQRVRSIADKVITISTHVTASHQTPSEIADSLAIEHLHTYI